VIPSWAYGGEIDPTLVLLRDEAKFYVSRYVTLRRTAIDMQKTHIFIQELPLPDEVFGAWCAVNASGIIGSSFLSDQKLTPLCNTQFDRSSCPNTREPAAFYWARLCNSSLRRKQLHTFFLCSVVVTE